MRIEPSTKPSAGTSCTSRTTVPGSGSRNVPFAGPNAFALTSPRSSGLVSMGAVARGGGGGQSVADLGTDPVAGGGT